MLHWFYLILIYVWSSVKVPELSIGKDGVVEKETLEIRIIGNKSNLTIVVKMKNLICKLSSFEIYPSSCLPFDRSIVAVVDCHRTSFNTIYCNDSRFLSYFNFFLDFSLMIFSVTSSLIHSYVGDSTHNSSFHFERPSASSNSLTPIGYNLYF